MTTLTHHGHACVRLTGASGALVVDPGVLSDLDAALDGVDGVLVTHEHSDHVAVERVAAAVAAGVPLWAPAAVVALLAEQGAPVDGMTSVLAGDRVGAAGFDVAVLGERHAVIHPDVPGVANVGYLVDGTVLHPGDAFVDAPAGSLVDVLCTPVGAPWLKIAEVVDWVREVHPRRLVPVHDGQLSEVGRGLALRLLGQLTAAQVVALGPGESLDLT